MKNVGVICRVVIDDVNLEVRQALDCNCTEISYLARQLSVLVNRQLVTGLLGRLFGEFRRMENLMVNAETMIYTGSVRRISVPTSSLGGKYIAPCAWGSNC
jgi:hypothetical protein